MDIVYNARHRLEPAVLEGLDRQIGGGCGELTMTETIRHQHPCRVLDLDHAPGVAAKSFALFRGSGDPEQLFTLAETRHQDRAARERIGIEFGRQALHRAQARAGSPRRRKTVSQAGIEIHPGAMIDRQDLKAASERAQYDFAFLRVFTRLLAASVTTTPTSAESDSPKSRSVGELHTDAAGFRGLASFLYRNRLRRLN